MRVFVCLLAVLRIYTVTVLAIKTKGDMVLSPYSPGARFTKVPKSNLGKLFA